MLKEKADTRKQPGERSSVAASKEQRTERTDTRLMRAKHPANSLK
jgi:hypothetical protein